MHSNGMVPGADCGLQAEPGWVIPILINGETVRNFKFLNVHISEKLEWSTHTENVVKKAQQRLLKLRMLKKFFLSLRALTVFYRITIESILLGCITAWYCNCTTADCKVLQRAVHCLTHHWVHCLPYRTPTTPGVAGRPRR